MPKQGDFAGGWLPIESAPKDGRSVFVGQQVEQYGFVSGTGYFCGAIGGFGGWICKGYVATHDRNIFFGAPSYWMPIPEPPK